MSQEKMKVPALKDPSLTEVGKCRQWEPWLNCVLCPCWDAEWDSLSVLFFKRRNYFL